MTTVDLVVLGLGNPGEQYRHTRHNVGADAIEVLAARHGAKLRVEKGDTLYMTEAPDGLRITPHSPEFEKQMEAAQVIMKKRRAVLRELAK